MSREVIVYGLAVQHPVCLLRRLHEHLRRWMLQHLRGWLYGLLHRVQGLYRVRFDVQRRLHEWLRFGLCRDLCGWAWSHGFYHPSSLLDGETAGVGIRPLLFPETGM